VDRRASHFAAVFRHRRHVAISLSNLAVDLRELGEHGRARELDEQALAMRQRLSERQLTVRLACSVNDAVNVLPCATCAYLDSRCS
jgi:hypothetical protein